MGSCASALRFVLTIAVVTVGAGAQTTHVVGPGGQIRAALAIAAPGDVIVVQNGTYAQFDVAIGVTIRAVSPGNVTIAYDPAFLPAGCGTTPGCIAAEGVCRFTIPAGQTANVVGLHFDDAPGFVTGGFVFPGVEVLGGRVTFDDCVIQSLRQASLAIVQATVHLQECTVENLNQTSSGHGLAASDATITVVGGDFFGNFSAISPLAIGNGVNLTNCAFQGSHFRARGAPLVFATPPGPGVRGNGGSAWISDALIEGGSACAIVHTGTLRIARTTLLGAACATPPASAVLGVDRLSPLQTGATFALDFKTTANGLVVVFASPSLATLPSGLFEPWPHLDLAGLLDGGVLVANASGVAAATYPVPNVPLLVGQAFWFQGISFPALPLATSPVSGGIVR